MIRLYDKNELKNILTDLAPGVYAISAIGETKYQRQSVTVPFARLDSGMFAPAETDGEGNIGKTRTLDKEVAFIDKEFQRSFDDIPFGNLSIQKVADTIKEYLAVRPHIAPDDFCGNEFGGADLELFFQQPDKFIESLCDGVYRIRGTSKKARVNPRMVFIMHDGITQRINENDDGTWNLVNQTVKSIIDEAHIRFGGQYDIKKVRIP